MSSKEIVMQRGPDLPQSCAMVQTMLASSVDSVKEKVEATDHRAVELARCVDRDSAEMWKAIHAGDEVIRTQLIAHEKETFKVIQEIRDQLLMRVPAWALALMVGGASIIGALSMYILDHMK